jgi:hypothetical protein
MTDTLHRHTTTANDKIFDHCDLQLSISSSNAPFEPSKSLLKTPGTKWHHPHHPGTESSCAEASNSEQLPSRFALLPPVDVPLFDSCHLAFIRGFSPDRTDSTPSKKVYSRCMVGALYQRAVKTTFGVSPMNPTNPSTGDTYGSINASFLPHKFGKNPGCTNSAPPPSSRHQDRTTAPPIFPLEQAGL